MDKPARHGCPSLLTTLAIPRGATDKGGLENAHGSSADGACSHVGFGSLWRANPSRHTCGIRGVDEGTFGCTAVLFTKTPGAGHIGAGRTCPRCRNTRPAISRVQFFPGLEAGSGTRLRHDRQVFSCGGSNVWFDSLPVEYAPCDFRAFHGIGAASE